MTRRQGRTRKKLLDDLKDKRGYSHLKEKLWIAICGVIVLEEALNLSSDRLLNDDYHHHQKGYPKISHWFETVTFKQRAPSANVLLSVVRYNSVSSVASLS